MYDNSLTPIWDYIFDTQYDISINSLPDYQRGFPNTTRVLYLSKCYSPANILLSTHLTPSSTEKLVNRYVQIIIFINFSLYDSFLFRITDNFISIIYINKNDIA